MWACRCCQLLEQEPVAPQVFDNVLPTPDLQAHTCSSRFVDHKLHDRQEQINARFGVKTPRPTLAALGGQTGAQLMPLYDLLFECSCWARASSTPTRRRSSCSTLAGARSDALTCGHLCWRWARKVSARYDPKSSGNAIVSNQRSTPSLLPGSHRRLKTIARWHPSTSTFTRKRRQAAAKSSKPSECHSCYSAHIDGAAAAAKRRPLSRLPARVAARPRARQRGVQLVEIAAKLKPAQSAEGALAGLAVFVAK